MAALAALGEMAAPRDEGVKDPLVLAWRGVNDGESTLNLFFMFSFWFNLVVSWIYGQASQVTTQSSNGADHLLFSYLQCP